MGFLLCFARFFEECIQGPCDVSVPGSRGPGATKTEHAVGATNGPAHSGQPESGLDHPGVDTFDGAGADEKARPSETAIGHAGGMVSEVLDALTKRVGKVGSDGPVHRALAETLENDAGMSIMQFVEERLEPLPGCRPLCGRLVALVRRSHLPEVPHSMAPVEDLNYSAAFGLWKKPTRRLPSRQGKTRSVAAVSLNLNSNSWTRPDIGTERISWSFGANPMEGSGITASDLF